MPLFILFLAVPIIEIALFIQVGGLIGLWPTIAIVIITAIIGTWMIREQGLRELANIRASIDEMRDPSEPLAHGAMILLAGALLLTPGFFTDTIGFLLLIPACRRAAFNYLRRHVRAGSVQFSSTTTRSTHRDEPHRPFQGEVIDGEFEELDPKDAPRGDSGWTRH